MNLDVDKDRCRFQYIVQLHICVRVYIYTCTQIHTHIHMYIHIHSQIRTLKLVTMLLKQQYEHASLMINEFVAVLFSMAFKILPCKKIQISIFLSKTTKWPCIYRDSTSLLYQHSTKSKILVLYISGSWSLL